MDTIYEFEAPQYVDFTDTGDEVDADADKWFDQFGQDEEEDPLINAEDNQEDFCKDSAKPDEIALESVTLHVSDLDVPGKKTDILKKKTIVQKQKSIQKTEPVVHSSGYVPQMFKKRPAPDEVSPSGLRTKNNKRALERSITSTCTPNKKLAKRSASTTTPHKLNKSLATSTTTTTATTPWTTVPICDSIDIVTSSVDVQESNDTQITSTVSAAAPLTTTKSKTVRHAEAPPQPKTSASELILARSLVAAQDGAESRSDEGEGDHPVEGNGGAYSAGPMFPARAAQPRAVNFKNKLTRAVTPTFMRDARKQRHKVLSTEERELLAIKQAKRALKEHIRLGKPFKAKAAAAQPLPKPAPQKAKPMHKAAAADENKENDRHTANHQQQNHAAKRAANARPLAAKQAPVNILPSRWR